MLSKYERYKKQSNVVIVVFFPLNSNCPKLFTHTQCAARQKLQDLHHVYGVPYSIKHGKIYYPEQWCDKTTGKCFDVRAIAEQLCSECRYKKR